MEGFPLSFEFFVGCLVGALLTVLLWGARKSPEPMKGIKRTKSVGAAKRFTLHNRDLGFKQLSSAIDSLEIQLKEAGVDALICVDSSYALGSVLAYRLSQGSKKPVECVRVPTMPTVDEVDGPHQYIDSTDLQKFLHDTMPAKFGIVAHFDPYGAEVLQVANEVDTFPSHSYTKVFLVTTRAQQRLEKKAVADKKRRAKDQRRKPNETDPIWAFTTVKDEVNLHW